MTDDRILDLLLEWEEKRQAGIELAPEELCSQCPELLEEVRNHIRQLKASEWMEDDVASNGLVMKELTELSHIEQPKRVKWHGRKTKRRRGIRPDSEITKHQPKTCFEFLSRARDYRRKGELDRAIADATEAICLVPKFALAYITRAEAYMTKNEFDLAIADASAAILLKPQVLAYQSRAAAFLGKGEFDRAIADASEAIRLGAKYMRAFLTRATAYLGRYECDLAIADANEAIRLDPNSAVAFATRGCAFQRIGEFAHAVVDLTEALRLDPDCGLAKTNLEAAKRELKAQRPERIATPVPNCSYCAGSGEVSGTLDDMEFTFQCVCVGGEGEALRWLLGLENVTSPEEPEMETLMIESRPKTVIAPANERMPDLGVSWGSLSICDCTLMAGPSAKTEYFPLELAYGESIVVGRQEGGMTPYLDPHFRPTQIMPGTQQRIVINPRNGKDTSVSRGHFTLVGSPFGIAFVNGVPRRGGGIRPPINGTLLVEPTERSLGPGEEIVVERGQSIKIRLPNQFEAVISAS